MHIYLILVRRPPKPAARKPRGEPIGCIMCRIPVEGRLPGLHAVNFAIHYGSWLSASVSLMLGYVVLTAGGRLCRSEWALNL